MALKLFNRISAKNCTVDLGIFWMNSLRVSVLLRIYGLRRIRYGSLTLTPHKGSTPQSHLQLHTPFFRKDVSMIG